MCVCVSVWMCVCVCACVLGGGGEERAMGETRARGGREEGEVSLTVPGAALSLN